MNNSDQQLQDQRENSSMEGSTAVTIEFLRARLLSERSISRTARQRADDLAKRVAELEEQLRIVSLQRMKAEKATADVLAILESNGISDVSETYDSSSDQDIPYEPQVGNKLSKEEENSVDSKARKNESGELSGSDLDFSPVPGRSLSWKGQKDSPRLLEKYKDPSLRRRCGFASAVSSPKHHPGKSCRQIRCNESRSVAEEFKANTVKGDSPENGVVIASQVLPNSSGVGPGNLGGIEIGEEKVLLEGPVSGSLENGENASSNELDGSDGDMEKALERQAQLIGQYEAMEKAQREWEEKFRENNNGTPDSCDPGNRSDITEERYEIKAQPLHPARTITNQTNGTRSEVEDLSKIQSNGILPPSHVDMGFLKEQTSNSTLASESPTKDFAFPMAKANQNQESLGNQPTSHSTNNHQHMHGLCDSSESRSASSLTLNPGISFGKEKASGSQNQTYQLVPHKLPDEFGGVLEALKQARQSLQQKINTLPLLEGGSAEKSVEHSIPTTIPGDKVENPVGCVGLFRLPTDFSVERNAGANFLSSSNHLSLGNYYPDTGAPAASSSRFLASPPYLETRSSFPIEDQFLASQYMESRSRISSQKPYFDPYLDAGLPSSSRYTYPTYPINASSYPDLMPRIPTREGFSTFLPSRTVGTPPPANFAFSNDHIRPNMYRW